jgi:hypothetical protein
VFQLYACTREEDANNELEMAWKKVVTVYFTVLCTLSFTEGKKEST